jgi:hypothetical protein
VVNAIEELGHSRRVADSDGLVARLLRPALDRLVTDETSNIARDGRRVAGKRQPPRSDPGTTRSNSA